MSWHYFADGTTQGPVDVTELQKLHSQGTVTDETPVWTEGMADWTAYRLTGAAVAASDIAGSPVATLTPTTTVTMGAAQICSECGKAFPETEMLHYEGSWICAACKPLFFQRLKEGVAQPGTLHYASIGRRFLAVFIDGIIVDVAIFLPFVLMIGFGAFTPMGRAGLSPVLNTIFNVAAWTVPALYEILLIGRFGATLGKMIMGIKVVTATGERISYARSTGRHFAKLLSGLILLIGYLMAFWDDEKRALHDRICNTRVVTKTSA